MQSSETAPRAYAFEQLQSRPGVAAVAGAAPDPLGVLRAQADALHAQARAEGAAQGRAEGMAQARADAQPAIAALAQAAAGLEALRTQLSDELERDALALALRLAEQIVAGAIAAQPERVLDVVRGALRRLSERRRITILVNPDDLELVTEALTATCSGLGGIEHAEAQADRRVARGGAVVRTTEGALDAQVDSQLARAQQIVAQELTA